jgi:hypothetical protein
VKSVESAAKALPDDKHPSARVTQDAFIFCRLPQCADGNRHGSNLECSEERIDELRRVEDQKGNKGGSLEFTLTLQAIPYIVSP